MTDSQIELKFNDMEHAINKCNDDMKNAIGKFNDDIKLVRSALDKNNDLVLSVKELAFNMKSMMEEQKSQGQRLKALEEKPAKRWDSVINTLISTIVGALAGALLAGAFMI